MEVSDSSAGEFYYFGLINPLKETVKLELHASTIFELNCIDSDYIITKSMNAMLKKFITKAVALKHTAIRESSKEPKPIFKTLELCSTMEFVILTGRNEKNLETTDKLLTKGLSDVLCNAINCDGMRSKKK